MMDLKVLHVIANVGAASYGPGQVALHLASEQAACGADSRIWCLDSESDRRFASASVGWREEAVRGFTVSHPRVMAMSREMERAALREGRDLAVAHQHALWTGLSRTTSLLRRRHGIPAVISPHGALEAWALRKSAWKKQIALALYERENLNSASCLHACSEQEAAGFREYGLKNPVAVIRNGISASWLASSGDAEAFRNKFGVPAGKRVLLYLSRITPVKGLPLLIEALAGLRRHLTDWTLVLAGGDEFGHEAEIRDAIDRHRLAGDVTFTGLLTGQDKRDAFAAADLFVLPTLREAAPVVVLEALGAGVPVVTTKGAPWQDLVRCSCGWWVDVDAAAIGEALDEAMGAAPEALRAVGARGRALVSEQYSWASSARMTLELYQWLKGRRERPTFVTV